MAVDLNDDIYVYVQTIYFLSMTLNIAYIYICSVLRGYTSATSCASPMAILNVLGSQKTWLVTRFLKVFTITM